MANISLDVHSFIAQTLQKYRFQSSREYTFLFPLVLCRILQENLWDFVVFGQKSGSCILHSFLILFYFHLVFPKFCFYLLGTFMWLNGEELPSDSIMWTTGQPDNSGDCAKTWQEYDFKLDDTSCSVLFASICEPNLSACKYRAIAHFNIKSYFIIACRSSLIYYTATMFLWILHMQIRS